MTSKLFRVQDDEGRGPYRPGFSSRWSDKEGPALAPWWVELGLTVREGFAMIPRGAHCGSAFTSLDKLTGWFSASERAKLDSLGFFIVKFRPDRIIAETPTQIVFAQNYPLAGLPVFGGLTDCFAEDATLTAKAVKLKGVGG